MSSLSPWLEFAAPRSIVIFFFLSNELKLNIPPDLHIYGKDYTKCQYEPIRTQETVRTPIKKTNYIPSRTYIISKSLGRGGTILGFMGMVVVEDVVVVEVDGMVVEDVVVMVVVEVPHQCQYKTNYRHFSNNMLVNFSNYL